MNYESIYFVSDAISFMCMHICMYIGVDVTRENDESSLYLGFGGVNDKSSDDKSTEREITGALLLGPR